MKSRALLVLVVLAIVFSIVSVVSDVGIKQITGATADELTDLPATFGLTLWLVVVYNK